MNWYTAFGLSLLGAVAMGVALSWAIPDTNWDRQHKLCDKSVDKLLHSNDLVEVVRAGFIVYRLECSIGIRLTGEPL